MAKREVPLHNIPVKRTELSRQLREAFSYPAGTWVPVDYSTIELRLLLDLRRKR